MVKEILLIEDSPTQAEMAKRTLEGAGYRVIWAKDGEEGLERAKKMRPNLIITDIMMPKMDGYELCKAVKRDFLVSHIPVVILTSKNEPADIVYGLEAGCDNFITKPYSPEELVDRVEAIFEQLETLSGRCEMFEEFGSKITLTANRYQILNLLLETLRKSITCDVLGFLLLSSEKHPFYLVSRKPVKEEPSRLFIWKLISAINLLRDDVIEISEVELIPVVRDDTVREIEEPFKSFINVPLLVEERMIGGLGAASLTPDALKIDDVKFLYDLGVCSAKVFDKIER
jgi:DNA-binding response OmpR family regulator